MQIETLSIKALKEAPYNPRKITDDALSRLERSIAEFGIVEPIIVNKQTGYTVVGGHQRLKVLKKQGVTDTDCVIVDLPADREKALNIALNNQKLAGEYDFALLADLLQEIDTGALDMAITGFNEQELEEIASWAPKDEREETEPIPEVPVNPVSQLGDVWELGRHRLLCGDSTKEGDVNLVLNGAVPFIMVTDPPYGVEYDPEWRNEAAEKGQISFAARREGKVSNDDRIDWADAYKLFPGDVAYVWHASYFVAETAISLKAVGFNIRASIIWAKPTFAISRGHYHWQHEPCWYVVRKGKTSKWCGDRSQSTIWNIPVRDDSGNTNHGTQKPVDCMARPIRNHGQAGDGVYDPFVGSGTSLIASEKEGRCCYAIEIDPGYVDVAVKRWQNFTGKRAVNLTRKGVEIP